MKLDKIAKSAALFALYEAAQTLGRAVVSLWASRKERERKREEAKKGKRIKKLLVKMSRKVAQLEAGVVLLFKRAEAAQDAPCACECAAPDEDAPEEEEAPQPAPKRRRSRKK